MSSAPSARTAFNLKVLRRHDPSIVTILETASFVVLYNYNDGEWTKTGVEGPLFLFRRRLPPYNGFFLMNRNGVENFSADVTPEDDLEITPEFIIYRPETSNEVYGIWVFEANQRMAVGDKMLKLQNMMERPSEEDVNLAEKLESVAVGAPAAVEGKQTAGVAATATGQKGGKESEGKAGKAKANGKPKRGAKQAVERSNDETTSARATPVPANDASMDSEVGRQINLDDLFGAPVAPSLSAAQVAEEPSDSAHEAVSKEPESNGASLLDSLFQKASLNPVPAPSSTTTTAEAPQAPTQSTQPNHSQNLLALLGATNTSQPSTPPVNPAPTQAPTEQNVSQPKTAPKMSELIEQGIRDRIGLGDDNQPLSRREFVTELLSLVHTNPDFVKELYDEYLSRVA